MSADFTQDSVLHFLQSSGGSAKNSDLLQHFRFFLRDHVDRDRNREQFKRFVNSVATVKQEDGSSHVVLRRRFRGHVPGATGDFSLGNGARSPTGGGEAPPGRRGVGGAAGKTILPAAGIIVNNNNQREPEISRNGREAPAAPVGVQQRAGPQSSAPAQVSQHVTPCLRGRGLQPVGGLHQDPPQTYIARHRPSYRAAVSCDDDDDEEEEVPVIRGVTEGTWPPSRPSGGAVPSSSSPLCMVKRPAPPPGSSSPEKTTPKIYIQSVEGTGSRWDPEHVQGRSEPSHSRPSLEGHRPQLHQGVQQQQLVPGGGPGQRAWLSSSHGSISSLSSEVGFFSGDCPPRGPLLGSQRVSSCEALQVAAGDNRGRSQAQEVLLHRPESPAQVSLLRRSSDDLHDDRRSAPRVLSWHRSTGDLYDDLDSSEDSTSSPPPPQHRGASRRLSSRLRSRMCRSLGTDLDQLLREEAAGGGARGHDAARLNRLHRISSSLSLHHNLSSSSSLSSCSTPPRCCSLADLAEGLNVQGGRGGGGAAVSPTSHQESPSRQSLVPLEPREHVWLVKGAAGAWPDVYALFREDATLLNRRDFISGFTVLHWIAKHGDHRVLNTLWYGVQKAGLTFDINSRSTCGHTPLHIAAIHNNKNVMRLLVNKFAADVKLRDTAGKRPWQYLSPHAPQDILQMLGAPPQTGGGGATAEDLRQQQEHHHHQRRRRRHHLSFASSGGRPLTISGKVKRSSSIAAFLKPLQRLPGHQSDDQSV